MRRIDSARQLAASVVVAAALLASGAGGAAASNVQIDISPAGATTASGTITATTGSHVVACSISADLSFSATSTGQTGGFGADPAINPLVGSLDALSGSGCSPSGATLQLLTAVPQPIHWFGSAAIYIADPVFEIVDPAAGIDCTISLKELRARVASGSATNVLGVNWGQSLAPRSGLCDPGPFSVTGDLALSTSQTFTLTRLP